MAHTSVLQQGQFPARHHGQVFTYKVSAHQSELYNRGTVETDGFHQCLTFSKPPEFHGDPGFWSPEHLQAAALASCFVASFRGIARKSDLHFLRIEADVEAQLERVGDGLEFTHFLLRPQLVLVNDADEAKAIKILHKAERGCLIARSLKARIEVRPDIRVGEPLPAF